jgi:hypothetical protein
MFIYLLDVRLATLLTVRVAARHLTCSTVNRLGSAARLRRILVTLSESV